MKYLLLIFAIGLSMVYYAHNYMEKTHIVQMQLLECYTGISGDRHNVYQTNQCDFNNNGVVWTDYYQRQSWHKMNSYPIGTTFDIPIKNSQYSLLFGLGCMIMSITTIFSIFVLARK